MKIRDLVAGCGVLLAGLAGAQVPNDDCGSATILTPSLHSGQCISPGSAGYAPLLSDSTDMAVPDFPYPLIPYTCSGYASAVTPANDVWYKVQSTYGIRYMLSTPDTCQLSVWVGNDCAALTPVICHRIASTTVQKDLCGSWSLDPYWFYLQISNHAINAGDARFDLCVTRPCAPDVFATMQFDQPTPVVCFWYDVEQIQPSSTDASDGTLIVTPDHGSASYTILWDDGSTDFTRSYLAEGTYTFTLTDDTGCQVTGSSVLVANPSMGVRHEAAHDNMWCSFEPASSLLTINYKKGGGTRILRVVDLEGRVLVTTTLLRTPRTTVALPAIASGVYLVTMEDPEGIVQPSTARFVNP